MNEQEIAGAVGSAALHRIGGGSSKRRGGAGLWLSLERRGRMHLLLCADLVRFYREEVDAGNSDVGDGNGGGGSTQHANRRRGREGDRQHSKQWEKKNGDDDGMEFDDDHDGYDDATYATDVASGEVGGDGVKGGTRGKRKGSRDSSTSRRSCNDHSGGSSRSRGGGIRGGAAGIKGVVGRGARKRRRVVDPWEDILGALHAQAPLGHGSATISAEGGGR